MHIFIVLVLVVFFVRMVICRVMIAGSGCIRSLVIVRRLFRFVMLIGGFAISVTIAFGFLNSFHLVALIDMCIGYIGCTRA